MSIQTVSKEIADDLSPKADIGATVLFTLVYYTVSALISCWKARQPRISEVQIAAEVNAGHDTETDIFSPVQVAQTRKQLRRTAKQHKIVCDPWQEILTANAILRKAKSPSAVAECLQ